MKKVKIRFIDESTGEILHENVGGLTHVFQLWDAYLNGAGKCYDGMIVGASRYTKDKQGKVYGIDVMVIPDYVDYIEEYIYNE